MRGRWSVGSGVIAAVCLGAMAVAGCGSAPGARGGGAGAGRGEEIRLGAYDEGYRRGSGAGSVGIFEPLDLPAPSTVRTGSGAPGPDYWQQKVDYEIEAELDAAARLLTASMRVTYHNNSPDELGYLWVQLEQNLFRPESLGTLSRSPGGVMSQELDEFDGGFSLSGLRSGGRELAMSEYDTLARVELPEPIGPGEVFEFELDFSFEMPPHLRRMGAEEVGDGVIFEYAQWFPQVCKYDDVNGWNTLPYLGTGEFYTDYGDYSVALTVPRTHIVGATGALVNPHDVMTDEQYARWQRASQSGETVVIRSVEEIGDPASRPAGEGKLTWRFRSENTRTFAWASSEAFVWDACAANVTGVNGVSRTVLCQSLYPREAKVWRHDHEGGGSTQFIKHSIEFYSDFVYPYPYPSMINVNGPEGGMEYPGIIFCGARENVDGLFGVTDHEVGHSWFPMIINSDERRHVWMDEGFNSFINLYSRAAWRGEEVDAGRAEQQTLRVMAAAHPQAMATAPDRMWGRWLGTLGYRKPALMLHLLREVVLGPERFDAAFREYARRWVFKSPQPADFFRTMEDAAGADLAWFWRGWVLEAATLDQSVDGFGTTGPDQAWATFTSRGRMVMPVLYRVTYSDGTSEDRRAPVEAFGPTDRWRAWWNPRGRRVTKVEVDPDGLMPDVDRTNNER